MGFDTLVLVHVVLLSEQDVIWRSRGRAEEGGEASFGFEAVRIDREKFEPP